MNEKFPIDWGPFFPFSVWSAAQAVKTDAMAGDKIEFFFEFGERRLRIDSRDDAAHTKELGYPAEERVLIGIETESLMAEELADVEKIAGAATQIENPQRRGAIEPEILHASHIHANPIDRVFVGIDLARAGARRVTLWQRGQLFAVDGGEDFACADRMRAAAKVFPKTLEQLDRK